MAGYYHICPSISLSGLSGHAGILWGQKSDDFGLFCSAMYFNSSNQVELSGNSSTVYSTSGDHLFSVQSPSGVALLIKADDSTDDITRPEMTLYGDLSVTGCIYGTFADTYVSAGTFDNSTNCITLTRSDDCTVDVDISNYCHSSLAGVVADQHVAHSDVNINTGTGLCGGGNIASSRTLSLSGQAETLHNLTVNNSSLIAKDSGGTFVSISSSSFVDVTGDTITGDLIVEGDLTVQGTTTTLNTEVCTTSAMEITNAGTGPALVVNQTGTEPVVSFIDYDEQGCANSVFYIEDGGNVGIGTNDPNAKLTVVGVISSNNAIWSGSYNSSNWTEAYTDSITAIGVTGTATKTITLTARDGSTIATTFTDKDTIYTGWGLSASGTSGTFNIASGCTASFCGGIGIDVCRVDNEIKIINTISDTNTTYDISASSTTGGANLNLNAGGSGSGTDSVKLASGNCITVSFTDENTITINHSDTSTLNGSCTNTNCTFIQSLSVDSYGHLTAINTGSVNFGIADTDAVKIDYASVAANDYAKFTTNGLSSLNADDVRDDLGLGTIYNCAATDFDKYSGWIVSDGTDSETIASGDTLTFEASQNTSVIYCPTTNKIIITGPDLSSYCTSNNFVTGGLFDGRTTTYTKNDATTFAVDLSGYNYNCLTNKPSAYSLPLATSSVRGGVKIGYVENGKNYPVELSSEKMFVNVPWENTTYSNGYGLSANGTAFGIDTDVLDTLYLDNTNNYLSAATFNTSDGVLTLGRHNLTNITVDLDGKYQDALTFGIANTNALKVDDADAADNDYAKFTANGLEGRSYAEVRNDLGLGTIYASNSGDFLPIAGKAADSDKLDGQDSTYYGIRNHFQSVGAFNINCGIAGSLTTTSCVMSFLETCNIFDSYVGALKTGWSYAGNCDLCDAGRLTELAGTSWLTWTDNSSDSTRGNITALVIAPNTGGSANKAFIYNDQGSGYAPGWREIWTNASDGPGSGLDADCLDSQEGAYYLNYNNFTNKPTIPSNYITDDADDTMNGTLTVTGNVSAAGLWDNGNRVCTSIPLASSTVRGGVKIGYTENGKNYPVELSNEKMFVNVPWDDNTNTTYSLLVQDLTSSNTNVKITLRDSNNVDSDLLLVGGTNITLTYDSDSQLTIDGPDLSGYASSSHTHADATTSASGFVELATNAEVTAGADTSRVITPSSLTSITKLGTIATGTWQGTPIADNYISSASDWNTCATSGHTHSTYLLNTTDTLTGNLTVTGTISSGTCIQGNGCSTVNNSTIVPSFIGKRGAVCTHIMGDSNNGQVSHFQMKGSGSLSYNFKAFATSNSASLVLYYEDLSCGQIANIYLNGASGNINATGNLSAAEIYENGSRVCTASYPTVPTNYITNDADDTMNGTLTVTGNVSAAGLWDNGNRVCTSIPLATSSVRGGVKIGYTENGKNYPVELSNEKMFVNVPWTDTNTDTNTTYSLLVQDLTSSNTDAKITLRDSSNTDSDIVITGGTNITVTRNSNGQLTIDGPDLSGYASSSHTHTLADITDSGTAAGYAHTAFAAASHNHTLANITDAGTAAACAVADFAAASHTHTLANITDAGTAAAADTSDFAAANHTHTNYDDYGCWKLFTECTAQADIGSGAGVNFIAGNNVTISYGTTSGQNDVTISASGGSTVYNCTITFNYGACIVGCANPDSFDLNQNTDEPFGFAHATGGAGADTYGSTTDNSGCAIRQITLDAYGHVTALNYGVVTTCISDYRAKTCIQPYENAYDMVKLVDTYKYVFKEDENEKEHVGMMAHELQEAGATYGVTGNKDQVDENGQPIYQSVELQKLVPTLWSALKTAINKIEDLEDRLATLELQSNT